MIHVELSVEPHYKGCTWTQHPEPLKLLPDSKPPHVILELKFATWDEAEKWLKEMDFKIDTTWDIVLDHGNNEYIQHELELLEVTGQEYTVAVLSIEGNED